MSEYLFVLGRARELCQAEVKSVLAREKIVHKSVFSSLEIFHISTSKPLDVNYLIQTLGGTIKIAEVIEIVENDDEDIIIDRLTTLIQRSIRVDLPASWRSQKITFGISVYDGFWFNDLHHFSKKIKEELEKNRLRVRFILPSEGTSLSSVVVSKQKVLELNLVKENDRVIIAETLAVQNFQEWGKRDFARPAPDPHRGMLPPKVARMMVNLASQGHPLRSGIILDPFCGVGTILMEGTLMRYRVIGGDQSKEAIEKTRKNLEWLEKSWNMEPGTWNILQSEATHISERLPHGSIDAIVTEPYLGPTKIENLKNIILGLEKLYLGCFRDWWKILKPDGRVVIALPSFKINGREFFVKRVIDTCENLGYTLVSGPYQYSRPQAVVKRNIYILRRQ